MKITVLAFYAILLSVASAMSQQKFSSLPIGANIDGYVSSIQVWLGVEGNLNDDTFHYNRRIDSSLETFTISKIREMANRFVPKAGQENVQPGWALDAITEGIGGLLPNYNGESKPATIATAYSYSSFSLILRNGKWEIPEEVFGKVKFQWGAGVGYYIPEIWNEKVTLYDGSGRVSEFSARELISDADNPCELPSIIGSLNVGLLDIPNEIALAKTSWWERAEITLLTEDGAFVTFLVNRTKLDGTAIRWSEPPPPFFAPPPPKIASLKRVGDTTEITVEGTPSATIAVEWTETVGGEWQPLLYSPLDENGSGVVTHVATNATGFYRVRTVSATSAKQKK